MFNYIRGQGKANKIKENKENKTAKTEKKNNIRELINEKKYKLYEKKYKENAGTPYI